MVAPGVSRASPPTFNFETAAQLARAVDESVTGVDRMRADIVEIACASEAPQAQRPETPWLSVEVMNHVKMRVAGDLTRIATLIDESERPVDEKRALVFSVADNLRNATTENSSLELAMLIERARVMRGAVWDAVAENHRIPADPLSVEAAPHARFVARLPRFHLG